ncbi:hypothetical protein VQ02_14310 [Methylobacterium variabile]|jgi:two-component system sensor kinase FixL|uniref:histidine kinase n=1 Tax=Methylobacterium variabile TaxID=298794 RepID=A0A0J6SU47_9HYPH|nr:ATP-binding protein [Methylobacterium variabile]KMO37047.1 hypothetical protein VQ02_14310 [Methylobacterium variabile]
MTAPGTDPGGDGVLTAGELRQTLDEVGVCTWSLDVAEGQVTASPACARLFGVPLDRLSTFAEIQALVHPDDRRGWEDAIQRTLRAGGAYEFDHRVVRPDGEVCWLRSRGRVHLAASGRACRYRGTIVSIDEHQRIHARLQELQSELVHVSRLSAMGEMASTLAHELNQPLGAITNYTKGCRRLLAHPDTDTVATAVEVLDKVAEQALRAGQIIRRLRDFVARGETEKRVEPVARLIEDACALAMVGSREQGIALRLALDKRVGSVLVDRVQVQQILVNLIRNAREAMMHGPRRGLGIDARLVAPDMVEIAVSDTGPGIAAEVAERLFQPFVTTKPGGMGVGLSICRTISEAHGGRLEVERNGSGGATFRLTLPATQDEEPAHGG